LNEKGIQINLKNLVLPSWALRLASGPPAEAGPAQPRAALACFRASPWPSSRLASPGPRRAPARPHSRACALTPAEADRRVAPPVAELLTVRPRATGFLTLLAES